MLPPSSEWLNLVQVDTEGGTMLITLADCKDWGKREEGTDFVPSTRQESEVIRMALPRPTTSRKSSTVTFQQHVP